MVTTARTGVPAVDHEFLGGQAGLARFFIEELGALDQFIPGGGRLHVDFDHPRVRGDAEVAQAWIARRLIALQQYRAHQFFSGGFDGRDQFKVILDPLQRRHEQVQPAFPRLGTEGRTGQPVGGLVDFGCALFCDGCALALKLTGVRQRRERLIRVLGMNEWIFRRFHPGLRPQRQAIAQRRVPRHQTAVLFAQIPAAALPLIALGGARQRKDLANHLVQPLAEHLAQTRPLQRLLQTRIFGADVLRQHSFAPEVIEIVFVGWKNEAGRNFQALGDTRQKTSGQRAIGAVVLLFVGDQRAVVPDRHAVAAPVTIERPARQLLAGVPLALPEMHQPLGRVVLAHALEQFGGQPSFIRPQCRGIPLGAVRVINGHKGRLAAHGQAHIALQQVGIDLPAQ
ncbi:hypothetical protein D3C71_1030780 [compost metagenome]